MELCAVVTVVGTLSVSDSSTSAMPHSLGSRLRLAEDGRSAEILVLLDVMLTIYLGESFKETASVFQYGDNETSVKIDYGNGCTLHIDYSDDENADYYRFWWEKPSSVHYLKDTFSLLNGLWFGGAAVPNIKWPIDGRNDAYTMCPHVVYSIFKMPMTGQERYWLSSNQIAIHVPSFIPLWTELDDGYLKLQAQLRDSPYENFDYKYPQFLEYEIAIGKPAVADQQMMLTLRDFHQHVFSRYLKAPDGTPDEVMIARPVWSTWARFKKTVTQAQTADFLKQIVANKLPISNLELDDKWALEYGDFEIDKTKFSNFTQLTDAISTAGARLTLWIHPFINVESRNGFDRSLRKYFVRVSKNSTDGNFHAAQSEWWDGKRAYSIDFTNPIAADWYNMKLRDMQEKYKIFAFKFDAGEINTLSRRFALYNASEPNDYPRAYARNAALFGNAVETRIGSNTQDLPIFYRAMDRNSSWRDMGLATLIPSVLHCSLHGYYWMLPDMVGGNGYNGKLPSKELFIRWTQANTFMLAIQFSYAPFDYDNETVDIVKKMLSLREKWMSYILQETKKAISNKQPIIRPMWWASSHPNALNVADQFLVGDNLLVAPVLDKGARSRRVFIPDGYWRNGYTEASVTGPAFAEVQAPLDILPYFVRYNGTESILDEENVNVTNSLVSNKSQRIQSWAALTVFFVILAATLKFYKFSF